MSAFEIIGDQCLLLFGEGLLEKAYSHQEACHQRELADAWCRQGAYFQEVAFIRILKEVLSGSEEVFNASSGEEVQDWDHVGLNASGRDKGLGWCDHQYCLVTL